MPSASRYSLPGLRAARHDDTPTIQSAREPNQNDCDSHVRENVRVAEPPDDFGATMQEYLRATPVIDCAAPAIIAAAASIAGDATDDETVARRCFLWVRDEVRHSSDCQITTVTCAASDVLRHRVGFCYAKSHLLAALLRAREIPAALCYQRLAEDEAGAKFFLHGLVAIHLQRHGWYRVDPRGGKPRERSGFNPPTEILPYAPRLEGEQDLPYRYADALGCVVETLQRWGTATEVRAHLPDFGTGSPD